MSRLRFFGLYRKVCRGHFIHFTHLNLLSWTASSGTKQCFGSQTHYIRPLAEKEAISIWVSLWLKLNIFVWAYEPVAQLDIKKTLVSFSLH